MYYYTSDLHFGCKYIFERTNRPFENVEEMGKTIIDNFNERLSKDDVLIILGDVACRGYNPVKELRAINCKKVLIKGNHDVGPLTHKSFRDCFVDIRDYELIRDKDYTIILNHYPLAEWDGYFKGIYHFYGHVHNSNIGSGLLMNLLPRAINVGVDVNDFKPMTAKELIEKREAEYTRNPYGLPEEFLKQLVDVVDISHNQEDKNNE